MRWAGGLGFALSLAACYQPTVPAGAPCDPALDNCPAGQRCETTANGSYCGAVPDRPDGSMNDSDGSDVRPDTAPGCFGGGLFSAICPMPLPTAQVNITADRTINTAMTGNNNCDQIIPQPGGGAPLCLVLGTSITISPGVKLIGIGDNPLVLLATGSFTINGTIDVSSHVAAGVLLGAGAQTQTSCGSVGTGQNGGGVDGAGGGGAGGSFSTMGGTGGNGRNGGSGGTPGSTQAVTDLRGGCPGGKGGAGSGGGGAGNPGNGGGAVYVIAGGSLTISGTIDASGSGGGGGGGAVNAGSGGGGGGSGGMIVLDAPSITLSGSVYANGAGGGGGNGSQVGNVGAVGVEPSSATTQASGGTGGAGGGGAGGKGYARDMPATNGVNGSSQYCAGGGGGGGAGSVRVFGVPPSSLGGAISPPPT